LFIFLLLNKGTFKMVEGLAKSRTCESAPEGVDFDQIGGRMCAEPQKLSQRSLTGDCAVSAIGGRRARRPYYLPKQSNREAWEEILLNAEYDFAYFDGLNRFYVAKEHSELSKLIAVPPNVFDDFVLVDQIEAEQTLEALRFSTSWRLTAPLRKVKEVFRVLRDKIRQVVCYGITMEWFGTWTPGEPDSNLSSSRATGTPEGEVSATNARCSRTVIDDQNAEATAVRVPTRSRATSVDGRYRASSSAGPDRPLVALPAPQAVMGRRGRSRRG
jgi:hypothetical protein